MFILIITFGLFVGVTITYIPKDTNPLMVVAAIFVFWIILYIIFRILQFLKNTIDFILIEIFKKEEYLRQKDKKLKRIIDINGHIPFKTTKKINLTSVGIVVSQFISTKAADSIFKQIKESFNTVYLNEKHFTISVSVKLKL